MPRPEPRAGRRRDRTHAEGFALPEVLRRALEACQEDGVDGLFPGAYPLALDMRGILIRFVVFFSELRCLVKPRAFRGAILFLFFVLRLIASFYISLMVSV